MATDFVICLDFDGVCNMHDGWKGDDELSIPRVGLDEFITHLVGSGYKVAIFSCRPSNKLTAWFRYHFDWSHWLIESGELFFPSSKPRADVYVDDRAVCFTGSFEEILPVVLNFRAYWEKDDSKDDSKGVAA